VYTAEDFSGVLNMINTAGWGTSKNAFCLNGFGTVNVTGAKICAAGAPLFNHNGGDLVVIGLINDSRTTDFVTNGDASSLHIAGNLFNSGLRIDGSFDENGVNVTGEDLTIYEK
jgi:hypothetical protein